MLKIKGYTLIEMLYVLSVVTVMMLIGISNYEFQMSDEIIVEQITQFFKESKTYAIANHCNVNISIRKDCIIRNSNQYLDQLSLKKGYFSKDYDFHFNHNGNIKTARTISYFSENYKYDFVFQVGSGSFYVKKERFFTS